MRYIEYVLFWAIFKKQINTINRPQWLTCAVKLWSQSIAQLSRTETAAAQPYMCAALLHIRRDLRVKPKHSTQLPVYVRSQHSVQMDFFGVRFSSTPGTATIPPSPPPPPFACLSDYRATWLWWPARHLLASELASLCVFQMTEAQRCQKKMLSW